MRPLEAPELDGFRPISTTNVMGVDYLRMQNTDGVVLKLSEHGIICVDEDPEFANLLLRAGAFVTEHGLYGDHDALRQYEPVKILTLATNAPDYHKFSPSSVYRPDAKPEIVIKAYEFDPQGASLQFHVMSWLYKNIVKNNEQCQLYTPKQYVLMESPKGKKTAFMEYIEGSTLQRVPWHLENNGAKRGEVSQLVKTLLGRIHSRLAGASGNLKGIFNDLHGQNIIVMKDIEDIDCGNLLEQTFGIIDQPSTRIFTRGLGLLMDGYDRVSHLVQRTRKI